MALFRLRKMTIVFDEIHHDGGPDAKVPRLRGAVLAVVSNPFAGRYEPDLQPAMEALKPLGRAMAERLIAALGGKEGIDAYGKGAIVGPAGQQEQGAAGERGRESAAGGHGFTRMLGPCPGAGLVRPPRDEKPMPHAGCGFSAPVGDWREGGFAWGGQTTLGGSYQFL
jgi:hypothetical protein